MSEYITQIINWFNIEIEVKYSQFYFGNSDIISHLSINSKGSVPLPMTSTGYRSHFLHHSEIEARGGFVQYALDWLNQEANNPDWISINSKAQQLSLF